MNAFSTSNNEEKFKLKIYDPFTQRDEVKEIWNSLLRKCPHTYFMSWAWKALWINSLPRDCNLYFVVGLNHGSPAIAFFLGSDTTIRHKFNKISQLSVNSTLIPHIDELYCEYDVILIDPSINIPLSTFIKLLPIKWDEMNIKRVTSIYNPNFDIDDIGHKHYNLFVKDLKSYYVCLDKVRQNDNNYLALLSKNRRAQIRRSIREYEKIGPVQIMVAEDVHNAHQIFDELSELHQKLWLERGHPGIFSNKYVVEFHKSLISQRFESGEIQLLKVSADTYTIGCLYNIIYDGKALTYITGFNYRPPGNILSPGYVTHALAIEYNAGMGLESYDFLEGEDDYKQILATDYNVMQDITIQKRNIKYYTQRMIVKLSRILGKLTIGKNGGGVKVIENLTLPFCYMSLECFL